MFEIVPPDPPCCTVAEAEAFGQEQRRLCNTIACADALNRPELRAAARRGWEAEDGAVDRRRDSLDSARIQREARTWAAVIGTAEACRVATKEPTHDD